VDDAEELLDLEDGVVARVEDFDLEAAALGGRASIRRLQSVELLLPGEEGGHEPSGRRSGSPTQLISSFVPAAGMTGNSSSAMGRIIASRPPTRIGQGAPDCGKIPGRWALY